MPNFKYNARDQEGKSVVGMIEAANMSNVLSDLRVKNLVIVSVDDEGGKSNVSSKREKKREWVDGENKVKEFTINFNVIADELSVVSFLDKIENLNRN